MSAVEARSCRRGSGRRYYGWYVVAACNVVALMTWGIGVFNQGVFLGYFVDVVRLAPGGALVRPDAVLRLGRRWWAS